LRAFEKLGFSIDCHELRRAPRIFLGVQPAGPKADETGTNLI
jgi:hypothetical protein